MNIQINFKHLRSILNLITKFLSFQGCRPWSTFFQMAAKEKYWNYTNDQNKSGNQENIIHSLNKCLLLDKSDDQALGTGNGIAYRSPNSLGSKMLQLHHGLDKSLGILV